MITEKNIITSDKHVVEILMEPIIKGRWLKWFWKIITLNKLFTISHLRTELFLKVTPRGENIPDSLIISHLHLHDGRGYCRTFETLRVRIAPGKFAKTTSFKVILPYSGQFWLDANIKSEPAQYELIIKQKTLEGTEGRGTISDQIGKENPQTGYSARMPIGAIDLLNGWLVFLTIGIFILSIVLLLLNQN